jgi:hypothetical protein
MKAFVVTGADNWLPFIDADGTATEPPSGDDMAVGADAERTVRVEIRGTLDAPRTARLAVRDLIEDHPLASAQLDSLMLLVSEVVTNAVTHPQVADESDVEFGVTVTPELTRCSSATAARDSTGRRRRCSPAGSTAATGSCSWTANRRAGAHTGLPAGSRSGSRSTTPSSR